jgi:hypothetical protein
MRASYVGLRQRVNGFLCQKKQSDTERNKSTNVLSKNDKQKSKNTNALSRNDKQKSD